jgi:tetratricopeptide (TPR) repeat protein
MTRTLAVLIGLLAAAFAAPAQEEEWKRLVNLGLAAEAAGNYAAGAAAYREALRVRETIDRRESRRAFALNGLGLMQQYQGQFADAEKSFQSALAAISKAGEEGTANHAMVLANLATLSMETRQIPRAEKLARQAMDIYSKVPDPDITKLAVLRNTLAELLILTGRPAEAEPLVAEVVAALDSQPSAWAEAGVARNNLAVARVYQGRLAEAEDLLQRSLAELEKHGGPEHPLLVRALYNLALIQQRRKETKAAGATWNRTVDLAAKTMGIEHPVYGEILAGYAKYVREAGDKKRGKALAARAAEIRRDSDRRNGVGAVIDASALQQRQ